MGVVRGVLAALETVNAAILRVGVFLALVALGLMVVVVLAQVWFRYVLGNALPWPDEAARFLMLWMTGLSAPWGLRHYGFVAIETLTAAVGERAEAALRLVFLAIALTVLLTGIRLGWDHVNSGWLFASSSLALPLDLVGGTSIKIKLAWMYMSIWIGMVLMTSVAIELMLRGVMRIAGEGDALTPLDKTDVPEAE